MPQRRRNNSSELARPVGEWGAWCSNRNSESDEELDAGSGRRSKAAGKAPAAKKQPENKKDKGAFFALREEQARRTEQSKMAKVRVGGLVPRQLYEMFSRAVEDSVIELVYEAAGQSLDLATEQLLSLSLASCKSLQASNKPSTSLEPVGTSEDSSSASSSGGGLSGPNLWDQLPQECKQAVLGRLTAREAARSACISREFAAAVREARSCNTTLNLPPKLAPSSIPPMLSAYPNLTSLSFSRLPTLPATTFPPVFKTLTKTPLTSIELRGSTNLTDALVLELCEQLGGLRDIVLAGCPLITDTSLATLARYGTGGLDASLAGGEVAREHARLGVEALRLRLMSVRGGEGDASQEEEEEGACSSEPFTEPVTERRGLRLVSISGCPKVSNKGVAALITSEATRRSLEVLDVSKCPEIGAYALQKLHLNNGLTELRAAGLANLLRLIIQLPLTHPLKALTLNGCPRLAELRVQASNLNSLRASDCPQLWAVDLSCPALTLLSFAKCTRLDWSFQATCPELKSLDFDLAVNVEQAPFDTLMGGCMGLEELVCNGLKQLGSLNLQDFGSLQSVRANGCQRLRRIRVGSAVLGELSARNCSELREVRCESPVLQRLFLTNCNKLATLELPWRRLEEQVAVLGRSPGQSQESLLQKGAGRRRKKSDKVQFDLGLQHSLPEGVAASLARLMRLAGAPA